MTLKNIEKLKPLDMTILLLYLFNFEKLKPLDMMIVFFFLNIVLISRVFSNMIFILKIDTYLELKFYKEVFINLLFLCSFIIFPYFPYTID